LAHLKLFLEAGTGSVADTFASPDPSLELPLNLEDNDFFKFAASLANKAYSSLSSVFNLSTAF